MPKDGDCLIMRWACKSAVNLSELRDMVADELRDHASEYMINTPETKALEQDILHISHTMEPAGEGRN